MNFCVTTGPGITPRDCLAAAKLGGLCATKPIEMNIIARFILRAKIDESINCFKRYYSPNCAVGEPSVAL